MSSKYRHLYQFCYVKVFSTNHNKNLVLLDDPGRVRSQITSVVCQIQRFDFDCNLVVTRKVIIRIPAGLDLNPLYIQGRCARKGHLVTRITVTLSIFIFSTRFLVQNCRESQGASF